jgi:hypothetical protein
MLSQRQGNAGRFMNRTLMVDIYIEVEVTSQEEMWLLCCDVSFVSRLRWMMLRKLGCMIKSEDRREGHTTPPKGIHA